MIFYNYLFKLKLVSIMMDHITDISQLSQPQNQASMERNYPVYVCGNYIHFPTQ